MTLQRGSKGEDVKALQTRLNGSGSGVKLTVDGDFGAATEAAVKQYQRLHGYPETGIADAKLLAELGVISSAPSFITTAIEKMRTVKVTPVMAAGIIAVIALAAISYRQMRKA